MSEQTILIDSPRVLANKVLSFSVIHFLDPKTYSVITGFRLINGRIVAPGYMRKGTGNWISTNFLSIDEAHQVYEALLTCGWPEVSLVGGLSLPAEFACAGLSITADNVMKHPALMKKLAVSFKSRDEEHEAMEEFIRSATSV